jgi:hypothetical protein
MFRRRRKTREIPFSFDSFLDVVANVVGIIIRLILVAWFGARACKAILPPPLPPPALTEPAALAEPTEPRLEQVAHRRRDIEHERDETLRRYAEQEQALRNDSTQLQEQIDHLAEKRQTLLAQQADLTARARKTAEMARGIQLSLPELLKRSKELLAELDKLRKQPGSGKQLRYHAPVSATVQQDEVTFECKAGRVTLLNTAALKKLAIQDSTKQLAVQFEVSGVTQPVGAFRWRYQVERERSLMDGPGTSTPARGGFGVHVSWQAEPVLPERGEPLERALANGSDFRNLIEALDPRQTVVTLWVYPDSFRLYRALRDYLHDREMIVAGRPLPDGVLIGASPQGTASRGQ